ncbi:MAG TPA: chemotaxis response regulator protein-glutamate methylesterase [Candidatus Angelobacter sp.]|nr:chemotaxis response regulator protein-glutamate methylesterase [Candidatus Angelobacter sp.]
MPKLIRVLVVDDSSFMRKLIRDLIESDPQFQIVGEASNGREAIEKRRALNPDVITLDVEMPIMNGMDALQKIMAENPVPVIMLSSLTKDGTTMTVKALTLGAVDYVAKPTGAFPLDLNSVQEELIKKLKAVAGSTPPASLLAREKTHFIKMESQESPISRLLCIGSSTGGPRALQAVLSALPKELPVPVLVVQHMPALFTASLAERLNNVSPLRVKEAEDGEQLENGTVYIAQGGWHMQVKENPHKSYVIQLDASPPIKGLKPSFDRLLESLGPLKLPILYTILTGMGSDGTKGLKEIKQLTNVYALAESKETSIIYGMPKAAINSGLIDQVLDLHRIASAIVEQLTYPAVKDPPHVYEKKV